MTGLSVVIPCHDVEDTLDEQLVALLSGPSDIVELEVICVDNRSTDGTAALIDSWAAQDPRVRRVDAPERPGVSHARNVGIAAARHAHVAICDGDDVVSPGWVAAMAGGMEQAAYVTGPLELRRLNPASVAESRGTGTELGAPSWFGALPFARGGNLGVAVAAWSQVGGFDEHVSGAEDVEFAARLAALGITPAFLPDAVVHYRYRTDAEELYRQGLLYGRCRPLVRRRLLELGLPAPAPWAAWRSWAWLIAHLPDALRAGGRPAWMWVLGNRLGQLQGSVQHRCVFL